ncbi:hypothetical protein [Methylobacterium sp. E-046]|uniref:hypothetical protein n=1 Tax=Methylobacterium sp. E-046 TaxID=2836576 RepID=UPI001FBB62A9|nr:hypothetical protein [Methylobacterium sp. E-046]MCJ2101010.1 hypothetical protein [Methylobacterium sp. E-046]
MILGLRQYRVQPADREPLVRFMVDGLRDAGCRIIFASPPDRAPFVITFETPAGERMGVVAYAFLSTRTPTKGRPPDERSFQIKYGARELDAHGLPVLHELWQDPLGLFTTLLVGIDPERGYFVSLDPEMHNPTKFFIRVEFKDHHAEAIQHAGWHAWERAHHGPLAEPTEVLIGGVRERMLNLVRFERSAHGLAQGDRELLAERHELFSEAPLPGEPPAAAEMAALHPLAAEFELAPDQILELIAGARRLKMAVRGWVAEEKLRDRLAATVGVTDCERLDEEGGPDLRLRWQGGPPLTIECKNVLRKRNAAGLARIDFQRTRASKADPCSRYYTPGDFDVVAGCLHAVEERWVFRYVLPRQLPGHARCPGRIGSNVVVDTLWSDDPGPVFEAAYGRV